jgi:phenol hydroxylase P5 protein
MSYQLTIEPLGATIEVQEGQTLLDAALRCGIYIPHACGHGLCGTCKVQVSDGEVDHGLASVAQSDACIEADIDEDPDAEIIPVRDFHTTVSRIETLTPTIKAIFLKLDAPLHFQAGQYVQLHVPGVQGTRAFSIANSPAQVLAAGEIELNVRIVPGGVATTWLHQSLKVGDSLRVSGPYGRFLVRKSAKLPLVFMAGGSGLSSPRSMIHDLLEDKSLQPMTLVYGQRTADELYYDEAFRALAAKYPHFTYVPTLSGEPEGSDWTGARGFVHDVAKAHFGGTFAGHQAYLCGPPVMIEACIGALMQGRLFERDIYTEKFLSAADTNQQRSPVFKRV